MGGVETKQMATEKMRILTLWTCGLVQCAVDSKTKEKNDEMTEDPVQSGCRV